MSVFRSRKSDGDQDEWFYCLKHKAVERGLQCPSKERMGPYPSRERAENALATVAERNREWDDDPRSR